MRLKEILKNLGYTDEQIQNVVDAMEENGLYISTVKDSEETINKLQEDFKQLKTENDDLKNSNKNDESASATIKKLQDEVSRGKIETAAIIELKIF